MSIRVKKVYAKKKLTSLNKVLSTIKSHVKNCKYQTLLILEIVLHVTWNSAFIDAE
jgi:2-polyprenyl-3-methyl-5-hydroxy-6-metoxy-1,4-benzoquinol methylase